jgi:hypothetical protein
MEDIKKFTQESIKKNVSQLPQKVESQESNIEIITLVDVARKYPRNLKVVTDNCLSTLNSETAQKWFYIYTNKTEKVIVPTIYFARLIMQFYNNIRVEFRVREQKRQYIIADAVAYDLESMLIIKTEAIQPLQFDKTRSYDQIVVESGNIANGKAMKKALMNIIPAAIIDNLLNQAEKMITGDISTVEKFFSKRDELVKDFASYGISDTKLSEYFKKDILLFNKFDIIEMISLLNQIVDSELIIDEIFGIKPESKAANDIKDIYTKNPGNH